MNINTAMKLEKKRNGIPSILTRSTSLLKQHKQTKRWSKRIHNLKAKPNENTYNETWFRRGLYWVFQLHLCFFYFLCNLVVGNYHVEIEVMIWRWMQMRWFKGYHTAAGGRLSRESLWRLFSSWVGGFSASIWETAWGWTRSCMDRGRWVIVV